MQMRPFLPKNIDYYACGLSNVRNKKYKYIDLNYKKSLSFYKNEEFDYIISTGIFHVINNPVYLMKEICRVAKPSAQIILGFPNIRIGSKAKNKYSYKNALKDVHKYFYIHKQTGTFGGGTRFFKKIIKSPISTLSSNILLSCTKK